VQTFLPFPNFHQSAQSLDNKRLGKQRSEAKIILNVLYGKSAGWRFHPAVRMWVGYEKALESYFDTISKEWINRGHLHNMCLFNNKIPFEYPPWFGNEKFHLSHQSNLIRKFPEHYRPIFGYDIPNDLPYYWPIK
jgi:hypothetical protein